MKLLADNIIHLETESAFKIGDHITKIQASGLDVVKLNIGDPNFDIPHFIKDEIKAQLDKNNTHYCDPKGLLSFREAICERIKQRQKISVVPEQIVVFPGSKTSVGFAQQIYCNKGDEVIYAIPGFPIYEIFINYLGAKAVPIFLKEESHFVMTAEQLADAITPKTKLIYLNFPSNPTGSMLSQREAEAIADIILSKCHKNVRIYSDEIYEDLIFDQQSHHSVASIPGMQERTIISSGLSKNFSWTGGRVGYAVLPTIEEAELFKKLNINYFSCVPAYHQEAAAAAFRHPQASEYLAKIVSSYQQRRDSIATALNNIKGMHCAIPQGAMYLYPNITEVCEHLGISEVYNNLPENIKKLSSPSTIFQMFALYAHQVAVLDQRAFGAQESYEQSYIRLSLTASQEMLNLGVQKIQTAAADIEGFKQYIARNLPLY